MKRSPAWAALGIAAAGVAAYAGSLHGAFVFDDLGSIVNNPTLARVWPPGAWWPPSGALTVSGRPLLNFSFALNHAVNGAATAGYHWTNLAIHVAAALALFGLARRTLESRLPAGSALLAASTAALVWEVHPLQTEAVTYVVQRAESLMGLLALLTLYAFRLSLDSPRKTTWRAASVAACAAGMAVKEVMVVVPLLVLLYDRTFAAGSLSKAWKRRRGYYLGLAGTWLVLAALLISAGGARGASAGWGLGFAATARYAHAQVPAIAHYLRLALWPAPLIFDYGTGWTVATAAWFIDALVVLALAAATVVGLRKNHPLGFLGAWFFLTLAPSSSIVPIGTEWMAEHRMYLPLAALSVLFCSVLFWAPRRQKELRGGDVPLPGAGFNRGFVAVAAIAVLCLGWATWGRNGDYRTAVGLWSDTVRKRPANAYAHNNLGAAFMEAGRLPEAAAQFRSAVALNPEFAKAHNNLGRVLLTQGDPGNGRTELARAVALDPGFAEAHNNLGVAYAMRGDLGRAAAEFRRALELKPDYIEARRNLDRAGAFPPSSL